MADPALYFLPWVRSGLVSLARTAPSQNFVSLNVAVTVNSTAAAPVAARLFGPGQVTGIDPRAIVRMEPRPNTVAFEPNYFPAVEFATPDFPWVFSPTVPSGAALRPWLCLVAVKEQPGVALTPRPNALPLLQFTALADPVAELPDLDEIAFWAHAQIAGDAPANDDAVRAALADPTGARASRLICPRKLEPDTSYLACLVPTYHVGVQAGISPDLPGDDSDVAPAWTPATTAPFELPVYASWRFATGDAGDFPSLAGKLHPPSAPLDVGLRPMDESAPGFGLPPFRGLALELEGALRSQGTTSTPWPAGVQTTFEQALDRILTPPPGHDPIITLPTYGKWPAATPVVPPPPPPVWLRDLNLDPRMRAAAGMGVTAVRADQENLMASAWDQFELLRQANQRLRQFQLARVVAQATLTRHIAAVESAGTFFQLTRPLHARVRLTLGSTATLDAHLAASRIPSGAVSAAFRRLVRRRGPLGRRLFAAMAPPSQLVERLNQAAGTPRSLAIVPHLVAPGGTVLLDSVSSQTTAAFLTDATIARAPGWGLRQARAAPGALAMPPRPPGGWRDDPEAPDWLRTGVRTFPVTPDFPGTMTEYQEMQARFRAAATRVATYISQKTARITDAAEKPPLVGTLVAVQAMVLAAVDPTATLVARAAAQLALPTSGDPLRPRLGAPQFPRPMSRALTPQQLLPGVDTVPNDTAAGLVTNPRFVEAYMVGLNDEMRRELAWRQYPVDSGATFFANFWGEAADIPPIATWNRANPLGANADTHGAQVVLLIRGQLLRRYPNTVISAMRTKMGHLDDSTERLPVFRGTIDPDVTFFGFALSPAEAAADPWYFVLSEHPSEPRFGFRAAPAGPASSTIATWNDLAWPQVKDSVVHNHLRVAVPPSVTPTGEAGTWGANAAQQAFIAYRRPVRVAFRATALLR
jgi:hypothetical protein